MADYATEQFELAKKLREQQGEINRLTAELAAFKAAISDLRVHIREALSELEPQSLPDVEEHLEYALAIIDRALDVNQSCKDVRTEAER
jgi:septal ring factor EnvC (AmiA/AmiB activator)